jgi:hypothetical protein
MAVVTLHGFETVPGQLANHMAASAEGHGHLTRLGIRAATLQSVAGSEAGTIATIMNHADNAAHAAAIQAIGADEAWAEYWLRVSAQVAMAIPHIERLGGAVRTLQCVMGSHPMTVMVSTTFADLGAYGAYQDAVATDAGFQEFWAGAMTAPTADVVRTGLYMNISPQ